MGCARHHRLFWVIDVTERIGAGLLVHLPSKLLAIVAFTSSATGPDAPRQQFPDHRNRNFKAFEEHIQTHVSSCFVAEQYLYNFSGLGVRVVWKLFIDWTEQRTRRLLRPSAERRRADQAGTKRQETGPLRALVLFAIFRAT